MIRDWRGSIVRPPSNPYPYGVGSDWRRAGRFVVEATAAVTILLYLAYLYWSGKWNQQATASGVFYSMLTGLCVGVGRVFFVLLFQKGGRLSAVPMILAGGAAMMATAGILFFGESASIPRLLGIAMSIVGLYLHRR